MHNVAEVGQANHDKYKELPFDEIDQSFFKHLLNVPRINKLIDEASDFANQFNWNIDKLVAYEKKILDIWNEAKNHMNIMRNEGIV